MKKRNNLLKMLPLMMLLAILFMASAMQSSAAQKDDAGYKGVCMNTYAIRIDDNIYMITNAVGTEIVNYNVKTKKSKNIVKKNGYLSYNLHVGYGQYLYYSCYDREKDSCNLYRYDTKKKKSKKVGEISYGSSQVYIYQKKLYYTDDNHIYSAKLDGSSKKKIVKDCDEFFIYQNTIYYNNWKDDKTVYKKCNLKGKKAKKITSAAYQKNRSKALRRVCAMEGQVYIYQTNSGSDDMWKSLDGKTKYTYHCMDDSSEYYIYKNGKKFIDVSRFDSPNVYPMDDYLVIYTSENGAYIYNMKGKCIKNFE